MTRHTSIALVALLLGCDGGVNTVTTEVEQDCDDGLDDDGDGHIDCDDPDCDDAIECTWPAALTVEGRFDFTPNALGQFGGAQACTIRYTSAQERERPSACVACDRSFHGPFVYLTDTCPEDADRPDEGSNGAVFTSETRWRVYFRDLDTTWQVMGDANLDGTGAYVFTRTDPFIVQSVEIGDLQTTFRFTPRQAP